VSALCCYNAHGKERKKAGKLLCVSERQREKVGIDDCHIIGANECVPTDSNYSIVFTDVKHCGFVWLFVSIVSIARHNDDTPRPTCSAAVAARSG
jgi:hypothetical protein